MLKGASRTHRCLKPCWISTHCQRIKAGTTYPAAWVTAPQGRDCGRGVVGRRTAGRAAVDEVQDIIGSVTADCYSGTWEAAEHFGAPTCDCHPTDHTLHAGPRGVRSSAAGYFLNKVRYRRAFRAIFASKAAPLLDFRCSGHARPSPRFHRPGGQALHLPRGAHFLLLAG